MAILIRLLVGVITTVTLLPFFPVGAWWVRLCDFPRLQIGFAVALPLAGVAILARRSGWSVEHRVLLAVCFGLAAWQFSHVLPYLPVWKKELSTTRDGDVITSVSVVNLKFENSRKAEVLRQLENLDSDLLLLVEFDQAWADGLAPLQANYSYSKGTILEKGLGLMLWSKLPLIDSEINYLVSKNRPSIFAQVGMDDGRVVRFIGVHPTPPGLWDEEDDQRHDSRIRDAELLMIAKLVADHPEQDWLISGDFNDVAWSHTTRMFQRISGLKDPRVGRGLHNTYHAKYPFFRFPIDQVFLSPSARVHRLERLQTAGSDHFAITTAFNLAGQEPTVPEPQGNDLKQAERMIDEGLSDAEK